MQQTFPNLEWVGVVVNWFGTSMDTANCEVWPSVEYKVNSLTAPLAWNVAGLTRATARQIGNDAGKIRYGGTPDDGSIVRLCAEIRARGLKVFFYPMMVRLQGVIDASEAWDGYIAPTIGSDGGALLPLAATRLEVLDLPAFAGDAQDALTIRLAACGTGSNWNGASILRVGTAGEDELVAETATAATMGACLSILEAAAPQWIDTANMLDVSLLGVAELVSVSELAMLNGANMALVGNEIIQFAHAELLAPGKYRLSTLLRGRLGTEWAISAHAAAERFVLLNDALIPLVLPTQAIGQQWTLRAVTAGALLTTGTEVAGAITGNSLRPLAPVHLTAKRDGSGHVTFSWVRRPRIDGALRDHVDVPLMEQAEAYDVRVMSGTTVKRSWQATMNNQVYTASQQLTDFGSLQTSYTVEVAQRSALLGPGRVASKNVVVQ